ncbi:hypothetical protein GCM10020216_092210 [Nonomuraea helvata]
MSRPDTPYRLRTAAVKAITKPVGSHLRQALDRTDALLPPGEGSDVWEMPSEGVELGARPLMGMLWFMAASVEIKSGSIRAEHLRWHVSCRFLACAKDDVPPAAPGVRLNT